MYTIKQKHIMTNIQFDRNRHGGLYDRGSADSYYRRPKDPHWYPEGTGHGKRITITELTLEEIDEYNLGYRENNDFKDWG
jgi:hypothetical protein